MTSKLKLLGASSVFGVMLAVTAPAYAQNTDANTLITNTANVNYTVGGVAQTQLSATDNFRVDRKILFSVSEKTVTGTTSVTSGQLDRDTAFTIVNNSNDTLDFLLAASNTPNGTSIGGGRGTDNIDVVAGSFEYAIDTNGNGILDGAEVFVNALTLNDIPKNTTVHVLVRADMPVAANNSVAVIQLQATALNANGTAITAVGDGVANTADTTTGTFQTVFADDLTPLQGNASRNGISWAWDDYTVSAPVLAVWKTSTVISDGVSTSNFKAIPGAVVEYCISVTNTGPATATAPTVSDLVPANTTFVDNSVYLNGTVTNPSATQTCARTGGANAPSVAQTTVTGTLSDLGNGTVTPQSKALIFRVTIN